MGTYVIVGAGAIGSVVAQRLADDGQIVRLVSRRGAGPTHESIERISADAGDREALSRHASGASAIFNCANPCITGGRATGRRSPIRFCTPPRRRVPTS